MPRRRATPKSCEGGEAQGGGEAPRAENAAKRNRKPEARDGLKGRGGPKMQEILFEILSAAVAACATFIGWILAKRNGHDGEDRDR